MKPALMLALRATTGMLLIVWGSLRAFDPGNGVHLAEKYYGGVMNAETIQMAYGWGEIALGALVILGLFRIITYPLQALILAGGILPIWKHILDPLGHYLFAADERANILFFPSTTVAVATLILIVFREHDALSLDRVLKRG